MNAIAGVHSKEPASLATGEGDASAASTSASASQAKEKKKTSVDESRADARGERPKGGAPKSRFPWREPPAHVPYPSYASYMRKPHEPSGLQPATSDRTGFVPQQCNKSRYWRPWLSEREPAPWHRSYDSGRVLGDSVSAVDRRCVALLESPTGPSEKRSVHASESVVTRHDSTSVHVDRRGTMSDCVDRRETSSEKVDNRNTTSECVCIRDVTSDSVDRRCAPPEYVDRRYTKLKYVDRRDTTFEYVNRENTTSEYVSYSDTTSEYVDRRFQSSQNVGEQHKSIVNVESQVESRNLFESSVLSSALCCDNRELLLKEHNSRFECVSKRLVESSDPPCALCAGERDLLLEDHCLREGLDVHFNKSSKCVEDSQKTTVRNGYPTVGKHLTVVACHVIPSNVVESASSVAEHSSKRNALALLPRALKRVSNRRCYNCDQVSHVASACPSSVRLRGVLSESRESSVKERNDVSSKCVFIPMDGLEKPMSGNVEDRQDLTSENANSRRKSMFENVDRCSNHVGDCRCFPYT